MSIQNIYVENRLVGSIDSSAQGWVKARDKQGNLKGMYEYASDTTRTANGTFYSKGNTVMMLLTQ